MDDLSLSFLTELEYLINDYYKCTDYIIKKQIHADIDLLIKALELCQEGEI